MLNERRGCLRDRPASWAQLSCCPGCRHYVLLGSRCTRAVLGNRTLFSLSHSRRLPAWSNLQASTTGRAKMLERQHHQEPANPRCDMWRVGRRTGVGATTAPACFRRRVDPTSRRRPHLPVYLPPERRICVEWLIGMAYEVRPYESTNVRSIRHSQRTELEWQT
jgi:hypothetical protein